MFKKHVFFIIFLLTKNEINAQQSVARMWNDTMLQAIREDLARPPVQARNLFHISIAMYDAWTAYDAVATPYLLGKTVGSYNCPYTGITSVFPANVDSARKVSISYATYRILLKRYSNSPNAATSAKRFHNLMITLGYDTAYRSTNYATGTPADLGNYIAQQVLAMGLTDGAREQFNYQNLDYTSVNTAINTELSGNPNMTNPNRWQPLFNTSALDQNGNPINSLQKFEGAEWGRVVPFALTNPTNNYRDGKLFPVYHDPGPPPMLDTVNVLDSSSYYFKKSHSMVAVWSSHHTPDDGVMWDISPNARGNVQGLPTTLHGQMNFYDYYNGGDPGTGYTMNPVTGMAYAPQLVKRGDFTRVVSQFWADGPTSETPPGHWFSILNKVGDKPGFLHKYEGQGNVLPRLEWDVKSYFALGSAMHDAAVAAWSVKGWYDSPRPFSMLRKMAQYGQSSDNSLSNYHPAGLPIIPGYIETIQIGDPLAGLNNYNVGKLKVKSWVGFGNIGSAATDYAGVDWIPMDNWMPYQRRTFVTPPFGGYVSGHSTYSRAAAELLTNVTGSEYFPGGFFEYVIAANSNFLFFEKGPTTDIRLQWATYRDASNESSVSRIWGGIHPPMDDIPGRLIGEQVGTNAHYKSKAYFTGTILPVSLTLLKAYENNCDINIEWTTTQENNTSHFMILKSPDGRNFNQTLGIVQAAGNSSVNKQYSFIDKNPLLNNFYKVVSVDKDGSRDEYRIMHVNMKGCKTMGDYIVSNIYPNPVSTSAKLSIINRKSASKKYLLNVYNPNGVLVNNFNGKITAGQNLLELNLQKLNSGTYFIRVLVEGATVKTVRMIKQ